MAHDCTQALISLLIQRGSLKNVVIIKVVDISTQFFLKKTESRNHQHQSAKSGCKVIENEEGRIRIVTVEGGPILFKP